MKIDLTSKKTSFIVGLCKALGGSPLITLQKLRSIESSPNKEKMVESAIRGENPHDRKNCDCYFGSFVFRFLEDSIDEHSGDLWDRWKEDLGSFIEADPLRQVFYTVSDIPCTNPSGYNKLIDLLNLRAKQGSRIITSDVRCNIIDENNEDVIFLDSVFTNGRKFRITSLALKQSDERTLTHTESPDETEFFSIYVSDDRTVIKLLMDIKTKGPILQIHDNATRFLVKEDFNDFPRWFSHQHYSSQIINLVIA